MRKFPGVITERMQRNSAWCYRVPMSPYHVHKFHLLFIVHTLFCSVLIQESMILRSHYVSVQGQSLSDKQVIFGNCRCSYCEALNVAPLRYTEWGSGRLSTG